MRILSLLHLDTKSPSYHPSFCSLITILKTRHCAYVGDTGIQCYSVLSVSMA